MSRLFISTAIFLTLLSAASASADEVKIATGHTIIKRILDPVRSAFREKTGIDIHIFFNDPVPALAELERGNADAAGASLSLEKWLELAKREGVAVKDPAAYNSYVPATEKLMIMVNSGNRIKALSKEQLKGVFTGKILNWKEVGGDDAPILVVWPSVSSGALVIFKATIMDNEPLVKDVFDVETIADTPDAIAATPEAIGIVTGTETEPGIKEIAPATERPLTFIYKGKPSPNLQKLLDFLRSEGKLYIN
ncbi:MAG: solute-binding protein [Geobacteraceae bacterium]|nr:solute-binding protein [Geobacteraceae bacterium]NTW78695.1 solute-binding protein [Geobacteraceae bacterium]